MRRCLVLGFCSVSLACNSEQAEHAEQAEQAEQTEPTPKPPVATPEPEPTGPPVGAWVVINEEFGLFEGPSDDARRILVPPHNWLRPRVAEVVAIAGDFIELRTIAADPERVCVTNGVEPNFELHFFVRPEALQPVLARATQFKFDDSTKLELAPGVPVLDTGDIGRVLVDGVTLPVPVTDADVGLWSVATLHEPSPEPPPELEHRDRPLGYGESSFRTVSDRFAAANVTHALDGNRLFTFVNACGTFVLRQKPNFQMERSDDELPQMARNFDPDMRNPGILGELARERDKFLPTPYASDDDDPSVWAEPCPTITWTAAAGTPLRWLDGGEAGKVLTTHELPRAAQQRAELVCFEVVGLDVCIETAKLERKSVDCEAASPSPESGFGRKNPGMPRVVQGKPKLGNKALDRDIVTRILRAHINEIRSCYNTGLNRNPTLAGRVEIAYEISPTGKVATSTVHSSTLDLDDAAVGECFAKAIKRWNFPKPLDGASVSVVVLFDVSPN